MTAELVGERADLVRAYALGLVTRRELDRDTDLIDADGVTDKVLAIRSRGHALGYVKLLSAEADRGERETLRRARDAGVGPAVLCAEPERLWLAAVPGRTLARLDRDRIGIAELADLCLAWGTALAALHLQPIDGHGQPQAPRPQACLGELTEGEGTPELVSRALASDAGLRRAAELVEQHWTPRTWIHGRLTADHVIVDHRPGPLVTFVGFGSAGLGDPSWDVAVSLETIAELAHRAGGRAYGRAQSCLLTDTFLHAYRRAGGPGSVQPAMQAVAALEAAWLTPQSESPSGSPSTSASESGAETAGERVARAHEFAARGRSVILAA